MVDCGLHVADGYVALHLKQKFKHFCKHWGKDLFEDAKATVQEKFIEQYKQLHAGSGSSLSTKVKKAPNAMKHQNSDDMVELEEEVEGDIVEALEVLKCLLHHGLVFCHMVFTSDVEKEFDNLEDYFEAGKTHFDMVNDHETFLWDQLVEDEDEDDSAEDGTDKLVIYFDFD
ncbi:hypothetical protein CVT25_003110 [Psilocybe cyanescens]|uniref:Uncharacterized protein n=1 Tax=Psilocybe cyanescens TaxID=93625 RepID=A0A409X4R9_PSICY|nr:hypothetical protein CVT25_003110 [Psilocybe cyanescens]